MSEIALTGRGKYALLKAISGETAIQFTEIQIGNGKDAGSDAAALSNPLLRIDIEQAEIVNEFVQLTIKFNNASVETAFTANEIGIMVQNPDETGQLLLYAYGYFKDSEADYIPNGTMRPIETSMTFLVYVGEAQNVSATLSQSLVYASKQELENHIRETGNVHGLTKEDLGLGNAETVGVSDMKPAYTIAAALTELKSGEKVSVAFGKIAKAIKSLIAHLADKENPHKVKCDQIGAQPAGNYAAASHSHGTSDITSGTLGIARGGTGGATAAAARNSLGITLANLGAAAANHNHAAENITSGILPVERGGTGVSTLTGSDFSASRVRGISFASAAPETVQNGHIVFVYAS